VYRASVSISSFIPFCFLPFHDLFLVACDFVSSISCSPAHDYFFLFPSISLLLYSLSRVLSRHQAGFDPLIFDAARDQIVCELRYEPVLERRSSGAECSADQCERSGVRDNGPVGCRDWLAGCSEGGRGVLHETPSSSQ